MLALLRTSLVAAPSDFLEFLGAAAYEQHEMVLGTEIGGISGLSYHAASAEWYAISDRGGRFYRFTLQQDQEGVATAAAGPAAAWRVQAVGVTQIRGCGGSASGACDDLDAEGIATGCTGDDTLLLVSTEGPARILSLDRSSGAVRRDDDGSALLSGGEAVWAEGTLSGMRRNKMLESLSCGSDSGHPHLLFTGMENGADADGELPTLDSGAPTRILAVDPTTGELLRTVKYDLSHRRYADSDATGLVDVEVMGSEPAARSPAARPREDCGPARLCGEHASCQGSCDPPGPCASVHCVCDEGFVGDGYSCTAERPPITARLLTMERSYSSEHEAWAIQLFVTAPFSSAVDVSDCTEGFDSGCASGQQPGLQKTLLLDFIRDGPALGFADDNYEAVALGPSLPDGRQLLVLCNDDNFGWEGDRLGTTFLMFALDVDALTRAGDNGTLAPEGVVVDAGRIAPESWMELGIVAAVVVLAVLVAASARKLCVRRRPAGSALLQPTASAENVGSGSDEVSNDVEAGATKSSV